MDRKALADFIMFGSGFFLLGYAAVLMKRILRIRLWPSVPAQILGGAFAWDFSQNHGYRKLTLRYSYVVDGQEWLGQRITVADGILAAGELLCRYIIKKHLLPGVRAYYDPRRPSQAVLVRPGFGLPWTLAIMGGVILVFWISVRHTF